MKALHSIAAPVPFSRVLREHRAALIPLGIVLAINVVVLLVVVLPLARRVAATDDRAAAAAQAEAAARAEFQQAEAVREGKARATTDLDTFYRQVLPTDVEQARRVVQSKTIRLADAHDVAHKGGNADTEQVGESPLERFRYSISLSGSWDDIRAFIYELETAPEFVVIDNIVLGEGFDTNAPLSLAVELSTYYRAPAARGRAGADGR